MNMHSRPWFRVLRPGVVGALVLVALQPVAQALTVYTAGPAGLIKELAQGFEQQGGEKVEVFQADSGKVMARVESEAGNPRVDVLISASWDSALDLHQRGWLLNYRSPNAKTVPAAYQGPSYVAQGLSALALAWNPSSGTPRPSDWKDLAEPAFQGKVNMPDPSKSGTALELISGLQSQHGAQAWKLFGELRANGMQIAGANAQALNPVLQGAKAVVVCNPSNPCGKVFTRDELLTILRLAEAPTEDAADALAVAICHASGSVLPGVAGAKRSTAKPR